MVLQSEDTSRLGWHTTRARGEADALTIEVAGSEAGGEGANDGSGGAHVGRLAGVVFELGGAASGLVNAISVRLDGVYKRQREIA